MDPQSPTHPANQPLRQKKKLGCWGWAAIILIGIPALSLLNPNNYKPLKEEVAPGAKPPTPKVTAKPVASDRINVGDQIKVLDATVYWKASAGNPNGPKLVWVKPKIKNNSKVPVGVVWATITIRTLDGQTIQSNADEIIYLAEGSIRGRLAPGRTYWGDKNDVGDPYPPFAPDGSLLKEQPVRVRIGISSAYSNPDTKKNGDPLE